MNPNHTNDTDLAARIDAAYKMGVHPRKFPEIKERLIIACETSPGYILPGGEYYPFVLLSAIPQRFHAYIMEVAIGSTCPAPDTRQDLFYTYDIDRWLRAIAVQPEFVEAEKNT